METDTRQKLVNSASELLYAKSYGEVGVQAICSHAGVKKGSFYHFFPSKRDLTIAVIDGFYVSMKTSFLNEAFAPSVPPLERFGKMMEGAYQFQRTVKEQTGQVLGCPVGNLALEMSSQDESLRQKINGVMTQLRSNFVLALEEATSGGELQNVDISATANAMVAYVEGVMLMAKTRDDPELVKALAPPLGEIRIYNAPENLN